MSKVENNQSQKAERSQKKIVISSHIEQTGVLKACSKYLINRTELEMSQYLFDKIDIAENDKLREFFEKLAVCLGIANEIDPREWLLMGITNRISKEQLEKWADVENPQVSTGNHIRETARHLLKKVNVKS
jgi:hypothetical protein